MVAAPHLPPDPLHRQDDAARRAEEALLGSILFEPGAIAEVAQVLTPGDFLTRGCAQAYRCMLGLHRRGRPCDLVHVANALDLLRDAVFGPADLSGLAVALWENGFPWYVREYAAMVKEHAERRRKREAGLRLIDESFRPEAAPLTGSPLPLYVTDRPDN